MVILYWRSAHLVDATHSRFNSHHQDMPLERLAPVSVGLLFLKTHPSHCRRWKGPGSLWLDHDAAKCPWRNVQKRNCTPEVRLRRNGRFVLASQLFYCCRDALYFKNQMRTMLDQARSRTDQSWQQHAARREDGACATRLL